MNEVVPDGWSTMEIGEALELECLAIRPDDESSYELISIRRRHGGMFPRDSLRGREILTKAMQRVVPGNFVIARRQIVHGACAIATDQFAKSIMSMSYSSFKGTERCLPEYFFRLAQQPKLVKYFWDASHGVVVEKLNFQQAEWLRRSVRLPPIEEQRRIAEILDTIDETIKATERVIAKSRSLAEGFRVSVFVEAPNWEQVRVGDVVERIESGKSPDVPGRPPGEDEWGVLKVSAVQPSGFRPNESKVLNIAQVRPQDEVRAGDVLITRANTPQLVGLCCIVRQTRPRLQLSDKTLRLVPNGRITPAFLALSLQSRDSRRQVEVSGTGSSGSMKNISQSDIRTIRFGLPQPTDQRSIVDRANSFDERIERELNHLEKLQRTRSGLAADLLSGRVRVAVSP